MPGPQLIPPRRRRLFFALWPDEATRARLSALLEALPKEGGRDVRTENLHLTLAFLGECEELLLPCLVEVGAALEGCPFEMQFDEIGHFNRARVLWLGMSQPPEALLALQAGLASQLASRCGLPRDARSFAPHLTLRRDARHGVPWPRDMAPIVWKVDGVVLVESVSGPHGVRYEPLRSWPLRCATDGLHEDQAR